MYCFFYKNFIRYCFCFVGMIFMVIVIVVNIFLENVSYIVKFFGEKLI